MHFVKKANILYDFISQKDKWEFKIEEIYKILERLAKNTKIVKGQLYEETQEQ